MRDYNENMAVLEKFNSISNNGLVWVDVNEPNRNTLLELSEIYPLHALNIEDSLSKVQIPKIDRYKDQLFIIIHFPIYEGGIPKQSQLSIFIGNDYLITIHKDDLKVLTDMFNQCKNDQRQRNTLMGISSGYLLYKIIDLLVDDLLHILVKVENSLDDIEDLVFDENISAIRPITYLRREIVTLRRIVVPLKRIVAEISRDIQRFSNEDLTLYLNDLKDHLDKAIEVLDVAKETVEIFTDTDYINNSEKTNKILAILTIVFTLSIPATLIAAFYGMNINLPGGLGEDVNFLGKYTVFIIITIISIASVLLMAYIFYRKRWLS